MQATSLVLTAGGLAFVGSFKQAGGFPPNGYAIIAGTTALSFVVSMTENTAIEPAVKGLGMLMVLAAVYAYVPGLTKKSTTKPKKKVTKNG